MEKSNDEETKKSNNNILKKVADFFWPILDTENSSDFKKIDVKNCNFKDDDIDMALKYMEEYNSSEFERNQEVESKASIFVGTFAVVTTILISLAKEFIFDMTIGEPFFQFLIIGGISLTIIYLCRAIWFSIKALEKGKYSILGMPDYLWKESLDTLCKKEKVFVSEYNAVMKNKEVINKKVDYMTMAQRYFKRAIVTVVIITILLLIEYIWGNLGMYEYICNIIKEI